MQVTPELLSRFSSLKSLPTPQLLQLADQASARRVARREVVLKAGEKQESLCFLFEGRLQGIDFTIDGREVGLYFIEPGDFCGELAIFDDGPQPEFVIALTAAMVVTVPVPAIRSAAQHHPELVHAMGQRLASRLRQMTAQRSLLSLPNTGQRVCCQLWMLTPEPARASLQPTRIDNSPTHMELAIMLSLSRETVSRVFQALQTKQIVKRDGPGALIINDMSTLQALAEGKTEL